MSRIFSTISAISDRTKSVTIDIAGASSSTSTTLDFNQTANRICTFPDDTGTTLLNHAETKTLTGVSSALTVDKRVNFMNSLVSPTSGAGDGQWDARLNQTTSGPSNLVEFGGTIYATVAYTTPGEITSSDATTFATLTGANIAFVRYNTSGIVQQAANLLDSSVSCFINTINGTDIYIAGAHTGTIHAFNSDATTFATLAQIGSDTATNYLLKYTSTGMGVWSTQLGHLGSNSIETVNIPRITDAGDVYINTSTVASTFYILNSNATTFATLTSGIGGLIVKYNSAGVGQWSSRAILSSASQARCQAIGCDPATGDVYATGRWVAPTTTTLTFLNADASTFGTLTGKNTVNAADGFFCKYSSTGVCQWIAQQSATATAAEQDNYGTCSLCADDEIYFGGVCSSGDGTTTGPSYFYNSDGTTFATITAALTDSFIIKYNQTTGNGIWIAHIGQEGASGGHDGSLYLASDITGVYLSGYYSRASIVTSGTAYIYNADGTTFNTLTVTGTDEDSGFLVKYNHTGVGQWSSQIQGTSAGGNPTIGPISTDSDKLYGFLTMGADCTVSNYDGTTYKSFTSVYSVAIAYDAIGVGPDTLGTLANPSEVFEKFLLYKNKLGAYSTIKITVSAVTDSTGTSRTVISLPNAGTSVGLEWDGSGTWLVTSEIGSITYS